MRHHALIPFFICAGLLLAPHALASSCDRLSRESVNRVVSPLMDGASGALLIGFTDGKHHRVFAFGSVRAGAECSPDENTLFEVGSLTKVFTSILLADFRREKKLSFDDPVKNLLPANVPLPDGQGARITLFQLATHSSGMPRSADNMEKYTVYGKEQFHEFLGHCKLQSSPGSQYSYSNIGYTILGEALENLGQKPFEDLLLERVLAPLKMNDTRIVLSSERAKNLAKCHDKNGHDMKSSPATGGAAGGLKSSLHDLLTFLDAVIYPDRSNISKDIVETFKRRYRYSSTESACLGWFRNDLKDSYGKFGQINGFSSALEISPARRLGIVVLSSSLQLDAPTILNKCSQLVCGKKMLMRLN